MTITIDGGVVTGTTSLAKNLGLTFGLPRIDSGSIYRALTYLVLKEGADPADEAACIRLAKAAELEMPDGEVIKINGVTVVEWVDGQRIDQLHTAEVDRSVAVVAAYEQVREVVKQTQRQFAGTHGAIADGRDTGTVVFPQAELKLFLVCEEGEAAKRRSEADGRIVTIAEVKERNEADRQHKFGALAKAHDAVEIDTTHLTAGEVSELVLGLVEMDTKDRPSYIGRETESGEILRRP